MFFARKMQSHKQYKNTVSARIIKIAVFAVALGVASIIIALATSRGLQKEIQNKTSAFNGHILVTLFENNESKVSIQPFEDSGFLRELISNKKNIKSFYPVAIKPGMLKTDSDFEGILFKGVNENFDWSILDSFLVKGRFPNLSNTLSEEIIISETLSRLLDLKVGDETNVFFQNQFNQVLPNKRSFTIAGIYFSGFPEIDQNLIYGDLRQIQRLNRWKDNEIGGYEIFVNNFSNIQNTADQIYNSLPSELNSITIYNQFLSIFQWIALFDFNVLIILIVMLLVGVINMATAILVLILERSKMVGLLKSIGAKNTFIQKIFLYNGVIVMSKGLLIGNLIGVAFYFSQSFWGWIKLDPKTYFVSKAPVAISILELISLNLFFLLISSILLWIPLKIILTISPSKVLRFR